MLNQKLPHLFYGGDYNPDQWPEETLAEDMRLFKEAGINVVTLPVFSWAKLQPDEDTYRFEWLDKVLDLLTENGIYACLATSTAAQPAWMSKKYPELLPVDFDGRRRKHGGRVNFCPTSPKYREQSVRLATKLAERYKNHPALLVWHIANEYGNYCYCDHCEGEFRLWLKKKYGTIEELNRCWNMSFWGHTVYAWDEIVVPSGLSEVWRENGRDRSCFQAISLDYNRFMSDTILECYLGELNAIRAITPEIPITTNLMGTFKPLDYFKWAEHMDIVSWDNYPSLTDPMYKTAMRHDLMRGLKDGKSFMLMEQTPSQQNWQPYNSLKRPGMMRLQSYQSVAHGADTVMFFQLRRSFGACEKYHGAVIEHVGHGNTRVFRECKQLGDELASLTGKLLDSTTPSKVAIVFDWENWWAVELSSGPSIDLKYVEQIEKYYKAFYDLNIPVDFVNGEKDLSAYSLVIAPVLYMVKDSVKNNIETFVKGGGRFVTTFFSGIVDENDLVALGGYPGRLRELLGIWVEEIDALFPHMSNTIVMTEDNPTSFTQKEYRCNLLCDLLHVETAKALAVYGSDFYKNMPVLTVNEYGSGKAYYIATDGEEAFISDFIRTLAAECSLSSLLDTPAGIEVTKRQDGNTEYTFILNTNAHDVEVDLKEISGLELLTNRKVQGKVSMAPYEVMLLMK